MIKNEGKLYAFLNGGGKMGELIRTKNWSTSPIGDPGQWAPSLKTAVSILLNSQFPMFIWWGHDLITIYNDAYRVVAGEKHPSLLGKSGKEGWAEIWEDLHPLVRSVFEGTATWSEDQPLLMNRHGYVEETYFTFSYSPVWSENGEVAGLFCACIETTEKVLAARKIQESERNLRATILQSPVAMCIFRGSDYVVEIANERMFELLDRSADQLLHRPIFEGLPETRHQGFEELLQKVYTTGKTYTASEHPVLLLRKDKKETLYVNFVYHPFREGDGSVSGIIAVAIDVTDQVVARRQIEESNEELQLAIAVADLGTFRVDLNTGTAFYSQRIMDWFGLAEQGLLTSEVRSLVYEEDRQKIAEMIEQTSVNEENSRHDLTFRVVLPQTGVLRYLHSSGRTYFTDAGEPYLMVGMIQDITPQVLYQQRLEESEAELQKRVEERTLELQNLNDELKRTNQNLEEFAYAASHDMKEPIRKIHLFADRLKGELNEQLTESQRNLFSRVENATKRMNILIEDLLTYSIVSRGIAHLEPVDLNQKIKNVLEDLEVEVEEKGAQITTDPLPVITGQKRQMQQLFQNLIGNALKYSKPDQPPQIHMGAQKVYGHETAVRLRTGDAQKQFYLLTVKDNGIGFEQEDAERIFQVFTRLHGNAEYKGTGVGLSIAKKVVENHLGYIWAESTPDVGTTFNILLPVNS